MVGILMNPFSLSYASYIFCKIQLFLRYFFLYLFFFEVFSFVALNAFWSHMPLMFCKLIPFFFSIALIVVAAQQQLHDLFNTYKSNEVVGWKKKWKEKEKERRSKRGHCRGNLVVISKII